MCDVIARALTWVLTVLTPRRPGRHSAEYLAAKTPEPAPATPWARPWSAPSAQEVRAIFKDKRTRELPELQRERVYAAEFARLGIDYDFPTMPLGSLVARKKVAA
ncbi:hypothetical protein [Streptomyces sp. NPDC087212]|uniref:hypothetical protein n=1 Tax=Streptomyces sp. NPDC087212 TaxID=3365766 RepID=UPI0037F458ED